MDLLVDTHTLIWMSSQTNRLSSKANSLLEDANNTVYASILSSWELGIKISLGKLDLGKNWMQKLQGFMRANAISSLPLRPEHCTVLAVLPFHHRDPFDRMLIAQAQTENLILISKDRRLRDYEIEVIW
ncbi:MAG TPA: type II toxin-antitoxin system VapC family toxin [Acidiferrobacteraceae bacterium]|nr:type II toxin-antitoxin system VapC family toxin [Acidiferrobacteraceae bacterium]